MNNVKDSGLFFDKEGRWFHEGVEITHRRTCVLFSRNLHKGPDGVKDGSERARFLRPAYYQICLKIQNSEEENRFWIPWRGGKILIVPMG